MILKIEQDLSCQDIEILIRYAKMNKRIQGLIAFIQSADTQIRYNGKNSELLINASDIFYIESVDKRTFVYLENSVYRTDFRLYQLAEDLAYSGVCSNQQVLYFEH